jgi:hypothetical protein
MILGGSLGNVPQKLKKTCYKNSIYFGLSANFQELNLYSSSNFRKLMWICSIKCHHQRGLRGST